MTTTKRVGGLWIFIECALTSGKHLRGVYRFGESVFITAKVVGGFGASERAFCLTQSVLETCRGSESPF